MLNPFASFTFSPSYLFSPQIRSPTNFDFSISPVSSKNQPLVLEDHFHAFLQILPCDLRDNIVSGAKKDKLLETEKSVDALLRGKNPLVEIRKRGQKLEVVIERWKTYDGHDT